MWGKKIKFEKKISFVECILVAKKTPHNFPISFAIWFKDIQRFQQLLWCFIWCNSFCSLMSGVHSSGSRKKVQMLKNCNFIGWTETYWHIIVFLLYSMPNTFFKPIEDCRRNPGYIFFFRLVQQCVNHYKVIAHIKVDCERKKSH